MITDFQELILIATDNLKENMKIPSREIQERVFGYYTEEVPPAGSFKAKVYELLANPLISSKQIEELAQANKRMDSAIEQGIIKPLIEEQARRNQSCRASGRVLRRGK